MQAAIMFQINEIQKSDHFRDAGNKLFKVNNYFAAIAQYNKALIFARNDETRASLCFANRSAVYLELKYFKHCLHNIDLAEKHYPRDKIQKLYDRRERCLKMVANSADKASQPFVHTFKLSYEPNSKLPFFIDAIQLKENEIFGKHLITTRNLKAGDVIAVIDNPWPFPMNDFSVDYLLACYNCSKVNNGDLMPGHGPCGAMFCSSKCKLEHLQKDLDHEIFHEIENLSKSYFHEESESIQLIQTAKIFLRFHDSFGNIDEMREFVEAHSDKRYDVFDFDWNIEVDGPVYLKNMLLMIIGARFIFDGHRNEYSIEQRFLGVYSTRLSRENRLRIIVSNKDRRNLLFIKHVLRQIIIATEVMEIKVLRNDGPEQIIASFYHPSELLLNHSCNPNIYIHFENQQKIIWSVLQPIPAGGQIFRTYESEYYRDQKFKCEYKNSCVPCQKGWAELIDAGSLFKDCQKSCSEFYRYNDPKHLTSLLKRHTELCNFINNNFEGYNSDPQKRQVIASKVQQLRVNLSIFGISFPISNLK